MGTMSHLEANDHRISSQSFTKPEMAIPAADTTSATRPEGAIRRPLLDVVLLRGLDGKGVPGRCR